jgi:hypothetical protein
VWRPSSLGDTGSTLAASHSVFVVRRRFDGSIGVPTSVVKTRPRLRQADPQDGSRRQEPPHHRPGVDPASPTFDKADERGVVDLLLGCGVAAVTVFGTERADVFAVSREIRNTCDSARTWMDDHPCPDPDIGDGFLLQIESFALVAENYPAEIQKGTDPKALRSGALAIGEELGAFVDTTRAKIDSLED